MAAKKDKLIESAQKFIAKGQLDRAINEYRQIAELDAADIRHRQKLAELLVRASRKEEAIAEYEAISKHYSGNHFYQKAIAVHKQIQKLDPDNINATLTLAALNVKQGLIGGALAEYSLAVNYYLKAGLLPQAAKVIEQMLEADPENLNNHLKCAEAYVSAGLSDKAYEEFTRLALIHQKRGDETEFNRLCERVWALFPDMKYFPNESAETEVEEIAEVAVADPAEELPIADTVTTPVTYEAPSSQETMETARHMSWEEEIDLSLLEEAGITSFPADSGKEVPHGPDTMGGVKESARQNHVDSTAAEPDSLNGTVSSGATPAAESSAEETPEPVRPFQEEVPQISSVDFTDIDLEIGEAGNAYKDWLPDSAQPAPGKPISHEAPLPPGKKRKKYDVDGQFSEFKKGVDEQLDKDDTESHYNLGIAYKEMCLFDAAIAELQTAAQDPLRRIDCLTLEGICYRDMGEYARAEEIFNDTLSTKGLTGEEIVSLRYEFAFLYEKVGRREDALRLYRQVRADNPGFRDAAMRIALLQGGEESPDHEEMEPFDLDLEEFE